MIFSNAIPYLRQFSRRLLQHNKLQVVSQCDFVLTGSTTQLQTKQQDIKSYDELPGPGTIENIITFARNGGLKNLYYIQLEKFRKFGPIFREHLLTEKVIHVSDADAHEAIARTEGTFPSRGFDDLLHSLLHDMPMFALLGNNNYEEWKAVRSPIAPTFLRPVEIQKFATGINSVAIDSVKRIRQQLDKDGKMNDLKQEISGYTTENILLLIYGGRMGFYESPQNVKVLEFIKTACDFNDAILGLSTRFQVWRYINTPAYKKFLKAKSDLARQGQEFAKIKEERTRNQACLYNQITSKDPNTDMINGIAVALSQVGVETTSTAVLWALYHLARNPEIQEKAYEEIIMTIGNKNNDKSVDCPKFHAQLPYLKACIKESLRLTQVVIAHTRVTKDELVLCGYKIPAGSLVFLWHSPLCYSSEYFKSPEIFDPERWHRGEKKEKINPFAYIPFGFGVRMCLGRRFAELELVVALAHILQNFRLEYLEKQGMKGIFSGSGLFLPERELPIKFIERDDQI